MTPGGMAAGGAFAGAIIAAVMAGLALRRRT
jgi:hypothetical protein